MGEKFVLDSWKEISTYLGRSVKTCRRWEHELGLPVHRLEDSPKARVFAYQDELEAWIKKTQKSEKKEKRLLSCFLKKPGWILVFCASLIALIILAAVIWKPFSSKESTSSRLANPSVAVLYFENISGDENLDYLRSVLPELLTRDLFQSKYIRVLRLDEIDDILKNLNLFGQKKYSLKDLKEVAERGRADKILKGSFIKAGDILEITVWLIDAVTGETIGSISAKAKGEKDIFEKVDDLTEEIKHTFGLTEVQIADDIDVEIGKITTSDPEALKYYMEGEWYHHQFEYEQAIASLEKAVEIDPEFAMAYRALATCYVNSGNYSKIREYNLKAIELKERLPIRERYLLEGSFYGQTEKTYDKAIEVYKKLLELYPNDFYGNHSLAWLYGSTGKLDLGIDLYSRMIRNGTKRPLIYSQISNFYCFKGDYKKAEKIWEQYRINVSDEKSMPLRLGMIYALQRKFDLALEEFDRALAINPEYWWYSFNKGHIYFYQDSFEDASRAYQDALESAPDSRKHLIHLSIAALYESQGMFRKVFEYYEDLLSMFRKNKKQQVEIRWRLGYLYLKTGRPELALDEFKKSSRLIEKGPAGFSPNKSLIENLFDQVIACIEMGYLDKAEETFKEINKLTPDILRAVIQTQSYYTYVNEFYLKGRIALKRKNYPEAVENLEKAVSALRGENNFIIKLVHAFYMDSLASAYIQNGDIDQATKTYEKISLLTCGRYNWGDIYAKSFYNLGKLYEEKDRKGKALEHYQKFLDLWKNADPGNSEIEDAKIRLSSLRLPKIRC